MHLLLPPSEAKAAGGRGRRLRPAAEGTGVDGPLWDGRRRTVAALRTLLESGPATAARALLLPDSIAEAALRTNAAVMDSRTTPALRRYTGVVYEGLAFTGLSPSQQRIAQRSTYVFSGLWGVLRGGEATPEYRVPAKAALPGTGVLSTFWRRRLEAVMPGLTRRGLIVDLRSADYAAMWRPDRALARRVIVIRVLSPAPRGGHTVISHTSKLAKGRLAAALVRRIDAGLTVDGVDDVAQAWLACGGVRSETAAGRSPGTATHLVLYTG